jgi:site-specific DNA-methyltransferase (adenine-specific)
LAGGTDLGRYPANVLHDGSPEVVALFPESAGQLATESSSSSSRKDQSVYGAMARGSAGREPRGDSGSAARFFNSFPADDFPWPLAFYHSKAGKADRRSDLVDRGAGEKPHPTVKPIGLLRHMIRHICPPGGTVLDPFAGTGTTAEAARLEGMDCVLMEAEPEYIAFLQRRFVSEMTPDNEDIFA